MQNNLIRKMTIFRRHCTKQHFVVLFRNTVYMKSNATKFRMEYYSSHTGKICCEIPHTWRFPTSYHVRSFSAAFQQHFSLPCQQFPLLFHGMPHISTPGRIHTYVCTSKATSEQLYSVVCRALGKPALQNSCTALCLSSPREMDGLLPRSRANTDAKSWLCIQQEGILRAPVKHYQY